MCYAKSETDNTPAILHGVVSCESSAEVFQSMEREGWRPRYLSQIGELVELQVPLPQSCAQFKQYTAHVIVLPQLLSKEQVEMQYTRGQSNYPPDELRNILLFGGDNWHPRADLTVILGGLGKEKGNLPPKLLFLTWHVTLDPPLLGSSTPFGEAMKVFQMTRPIAGREGLSVRRFCGAAGMPTAHTDQNILAALCLCPGLTPRKSWGTVIARGRDRYHVFYHRPVVTAKDYPITHVDYSVPRDGGEFALPPAIVFHCPSLGEAVYKKMMSVMAIEAYNKIRESSGLGAVAAGPVHTELNKINEARATYEEAENEWKFHDFIHEYSVRTNFSLVTHPVGLHHDHNSGVESFESRTLYAFPRGSMRCRNSCGRGGSIVGGQYVYSVLSYSERRSQQTNRG